MNETIIHVTYPSGTRFNVSGIWRGPQRFLSGPNVLGTEADGIVVEQSDGKVLVLDPRGTYIDATSGRILHRGVQ
jgi:hypothetical protein